MNTAIRLASVVVATASVFTGGRHGAAAALPHRAVHGGAAGSSSSPFPFQNGDTWSTTVTGTETLVVPGSPPTTAPYDYTQADLETCPVAFNGFMALCGDEETVTDDPNDLLTLYLGYASKGSLTDVDLYGAAFSYNTPGGETEIGYWTQTPAEVYYQFGGANGSRFGGLTAYHESWAFTQPGGVRGNVVWVGRANGSYEVVKRYTTRKPHTRTTYTRKVTKTGAGEIEQVIEGKNASSGKVTFGAPEMIGDAWVIPVATTTGSGSNTVDVPDWFPGNGPAPKELQRNVYRDNGLAEMPPACGSYSGANAEDFSETIDVLDPASGEYDTYAGDVYFVDGIGAVCIPEATTESYYDNTNTGNLISEDEINDVQILTSYDYGQALLPTLPAGPRRGGSLARRPSHGAAPGGLRSPWFRPRLGVDAFPGRGPGE